VGRRSSGLRAEIGVLQVFHSPIESAVKSGLYVQGASDDANCFYFIFIFIALPACCRSCWRAEYRRKAEGSVDDFHEVSFFPQNNALVLRHGKIVAGFGI
jgi:hypothetical protein